MNEPRHEPPAPADDVERLREALLNAAVWFEQYADDHLAKANLGPPAERTARLAKAERNRERAVILRTALKGTDDE